MNTNDESRVDDLPDDTARKKIKTVHDGEELTTEVFALYHAHMDSLDDDEVDSMPKLLSLVEILESSSIEPFEKEISSINRSSDFLGILASVVYYQMASNAIEHYLGEDGASVQHAQDLIDKSLKFFTQNATCRAMAANFGRLSETFSRDTVTTWYQQAARDARRVRTETLTLLENNFDDDSIKEWMEILLLNQICGVEYVNNEEDDKQESGETDGYFSASSVEGTSRFMSAMLLSRDGHHEDALQHLRHFELTHRLHKNVWVGQQGSFQDMESRAPVSFGDVLPTRLYREMCRVFGPDASFWKESDYANRGYFSFLEDIDRIQKPKHLIDEVVVNHLLPLAQQYLESSEAEEICAYEWWVHSRQASLGHMLHFDTDEANLKQARSVHHPVLSSVLHLVGDETSGPTIILNQTPNASENAKVCWRSVPHPNTFMLFNGDLLHGVLPCPGTGASNDASISKVTHSHWMKAPPPSKRRLTFMVGFKTRRVPDQRHGKTLYGPCAPLPSEEDWAKEIQRGYNQNTILLESRQAGLVMKELPSASPAWECIFRGDNGSGGCPPLQLPRSIDHRFFVSGAPGCFRQSLFENDDDD